MRRIICIGNALIPEDRGGLDVLERLRSMALPADVELVDGGLAGLDLLRFVDGAERVVFVDSVQEDDESVGGLVVWDAERVAESCTSAHYHHGAGLPWLLKILPSVVEHDVPPIRVVGIPPSSSARTRSEAALMCLRLLQLDQSACSSRGRVCS